MSNCNGDGGYGTAAEVADDAGDVVIAAVAGADLVGPCPSSWGLDSDPVVIVAAVASVSASRAAV